MPTPVITWPLACVAVPQHHALAARVGDMGRLGSAALGEQRHHESL